MNVIHEPGKKPYLYRTSREQPLGINQAITNNVDVSGVLPIDMVGRNNPLSFTVQPNNLPLNLQGREGTKIVPTNYDAWIVDGEYFYNRTHSNPTDSDTNMFNTIRQQQFEDKHKRLPIIITDSEQNDDNIKSSQIYNNNDEAERVNTKDNIVRQNLIVNIANEPFKQKRRRFTELDYDLENNLPIFMRNSRLNYMDLNKLSTVDKHTNKLIENSKNKLLFPEGLDDNTRWNLVDEDEEWTTTHNPQSDKVKEDNTYEDEKSMGQLTSNNNNESFTYNKQQINNQYDNNKNNNESFTPKVKPNINTPRDYYSANQRREYFISKLRTNVGHYVGDITPNIPNETEFPNNEHMSGFITDFDLPSRAKVNSNGFDEMLTADDTDINNYIMVNNAEYIYNTDDVNNNKQRQKQTQFNKQHSKRYEHYTIISSTNEPIVVNSQYGKETFSNLETGKLLYKNVLQSYAIMLTNYLLSFEDFKPWKEYWLYLKKNIDKCNCEFEILKPDDNDVAYVQNKGENMRFRIQDKQRFVPISIYTYVLCHELAHLANEHEYGHGQNFQDLMHLIELAAYELGIIKPDKYPDDNYRSNGMVILSKYSIKQELLEGINLVISRGASVKFYTDLANKIKSL